MGKATTEKRNPAMRNKSECRACPTYRQLKKAGAKWTPNGMELFSNIPYHGCNAECPQVPKERPEWIELLRELDKG